MESVGKVALVAANGNLPLPHILASLLAFNPYVLAANGGSKRLLDRGIVADAVIGDFDSVAGELPQSVVRISAPDQNFTDLDKAVDYLCNHGYETVWLVGATGDRLDHSLGALSVLVKYRKALQIALIDDVGTAFPVDGSLTIDTKCGQQVSLMALGEVLTVSTTGLKWNLEGETLATGFRDGTSNVALGDEVTISVTSGALVVYLLHE